MRVDHGAELGITDYLCADGSSPTAGALCLVPPPFGGRHLRFVGAVVPGLWADTGSPEGGDGRLRLSLRGRLEPYRWSHSCGPTNRWGRAF